MIHDDLGEDRDVGRELRCYHRLTGPLCVGDEALEGPDALVEGHLLGLLADLSRNAPVGDADITNLGAEPAVRVSLDVALERAPVKGQHRLVRVAVQLVADPLLERPVAQAEGEDLAFAKQVRCRERGVGGGGLDLG